MGPTNFTDDADCGSYFDHIDDLIEFPSENECGAGAGVGGILGPVGGEGKSFPSLWDEALPGTDNLFAGNDHLSTDLSAQLSVPYEDIVHLEWLSTFVEDSFSCGGMTLGKENPIVKKEFPSNQYQTENLSSQFQMSSPVSVLESSSSTSSSSSSSGGKAILLSSNQQRGAQRARSKRPRPATFNPRLVMQHLALPPPPPFMPTGVFAEPENYAESEVANRFMNPPVAEEPKKKKKKIKFTAPPSYNMDMDENQQSLPVRKCLHCEITKTPQWRAGPLGPKTLCNACGVRYKSGRLFPEYRPAASPTFVPAVHSNSHKKVLEMRGTVIVNEKGKDGGVGTAAKTHIPSQRDSVPVLAPAPAPAPVPVPTPFPVPEIKPKLEYM